MPGGVTFEEPQVIIIVKRFKNQNKSSGVDNDSVHYYLERLIML